MNIVKTVAWILNLFWFVGIAGLLVFHGIPPEFMAMVVVFFLLTTQALSLVALYPHLIIGKVVRSKPFRRTLLVLGAVFVIFHLIILGKADINDVYVSAFSQVIAKDDTYGGELKPQKIYINRDISTMPYSTIKNATKTTLPVVVEEKLLKYANENGLTLIFYDERNDLKYNEAGEIEGGGVGVSFGPLRDVVYVANIEVSIHIAGMAAGGTRYYFYRWLTGWTFYKSHSTWIS